MSVWHVTEQDRDERGRIRLLSDLLPPQTEEEQPPRKPWRPGLLELAGIVGGLLLAAALIAGMNVFFPAPAPRLARPTARPAPTTAPTWTVAPSSTPTIAPTATSEPTVTPEPPTPEPQVIY